MVQNLRKKLRNYRFQQVLASSLTEKNARTYKQNKAGLISLVLKKRRQRYEPSDELIKACMKPKILSFTDVDDMTQEMKFSHKLKLTWTRVPTNQSETGHVDMSALKKQKTNSLNIQMMQNDSPTSAENSEKIPSQPNSKKPSLADFLPKSEVQRYPKGPFDFQDCHEVEINANGPYNRRI